MCFEISSLALESPSALRAQLMMEPKIRHKKTWQRKKKLCSQSQLLKWWILNQDSSLPVWEPGFVKKSDRMDLSSFCWTKINLRDPVGHRYNLDRCTSKSKAILTSACPLKNFVNNVSSFSTWYINTEAVKYSILSRSPRSFIFGQNWSPWNISKWNQQSVLPIDNHKASYRFHFSSLPSIRHQSSKERKKRKKRVRNVFESEALFHAYIL